MKIAGWARMYCKAWVGFIAGVGDLSLGDVAGQFGLVVHGEERLVEEAGCAGAVSHPEFKAGGAAQGDECVEAAGVADGPDGKEQKKREQAEERGGAGDTARLPGRPRKDGQERGQKGGIDEGDDGGGRAKNEEGRDGGMAAAAEREQDDGGKRAGGEAGLPEDGGDPEDGKRDGPECAGEDGGAVVQLLSATMRMMSQMVTRATRICRAMMAISEAKVSMPKRKKTAAMRVG